MPSTYTLISSNVLTSSAASVTFSSIPSTYTDLVLRGSIRDDAVSATATLKMNLNNDSSAIYSRTRLRGNGSAATSNRTSAETYANSGIVNANTSTSNTFSSFEVYIPSYTANQNKALSIFTAQEDNITNAFLEIFATLYSSTTAISRIDFAPFSGSNFMAGSSFYLYGIKNS